jgi:hypothetical protein
MSSDGGKRAILSRDQVINIFRLRKSSCIATGSNYEGVGATIVARFFGVSSKTVRDIWTGRTWYRATQHLDPSRADALERLQKHPGRPKGSKDRKPRTRKFQAGCTIVQAKSIGKAGNAPFSADSSSGTTHNLHPSLLLDGPVCQQPRRSDHETCLTAATDQHQYRAFSCPQQWPFATAAPAGDLQSFLWRVMEDTQPSAFEDPFHNDWAFWPADDAPAPSHPVIGAAPP